MLTQPRAQHKRAARRSGGLDIVLAEALDRFSRDQEHVAGFHKLAAFTGVRLVTLSEGEISALHVGLKGTMNAPFLQNLAARTRRGIEGRLPAGRSFGPSPHGCRRIARVLRADGELERGLREIVAEQAAVVRRISAAFAGGQSRAEIARQLNAEGIPAPRAGGWCTMTLRGRPSHGDGLLRNRTCLGEVVRNRRRRAVDPGTGRAARQLNPAAALVVTRVPELRIIDDALWEQVQRRLAETATPIEPETGRSMFWRRRSPGYLLSGRIECGACGGPFSVVSGSDYRCTAAGRGLRRNRASVRRDRLAGRVIEVLATELMDPGLAATFAEAFTAEWNRLAAGQAAQGEGLRRDLAATERRLDNLLEAIAEGLRSPGLQAKTAALEAERDRLARAAAAAQPTAVRRMPNLAESYRRTLATLRERLAAAQPELPAHAAQVIARSARSSAEEGPGAPCPWRRGAPGAVRGGQRPARSRAGKRKGRSHFCDRPEGPTPARDIGLVGIGLPGNGRHRISWRRAWRRRMSQPRA